MRLTVNTRSAHTLLELMVALPLMVAVIAAAGGLIAAANSAKSLSSGLLADRTNSLATCQRIITDVQFAASVAEASANDIEFSTGDRDGDGIPDYVRYSWSGTSGDPVTYSFNGSTPEVIADNVHQFVAAYDKQTNSRESLIIRHDDAVGGEFRNLQITSSVSASQFVVAGIPDSATEWSIKRVRLLMRSVGQTDGIIAVSVVKADANSRPTDSAYETQVVNESDLDTDFAWIDIYFAHVDKLEPNREICIVVSAESGSDAVADLAYEAMGSNMTPNTHWMLSNNAGLTWSIPNDQEDMKFYVIGDYDGLMKSRTAFQTIRLDLQIGDNATALTTSTARFFNKPESEPEFVIVPPIDTEDTGGGDTLPETL